MEKRLLALALVLAVCLSVCTLPGGTARAAGRVEIYTVSDLTAFAERVGNGEDPDAVLMADLDLAGTTLEPIGTPRTFASGFFNEFVGYKGTFDGNGHTIRSLSSSGSKYGIGNGGFLYCAGFFFELDENGVIQNLNLEIDFQLSYRSGYSIHVGGVAVKSRGQILNCTVSGTINGCDMMECGGIVGDIDAGTISNCLSTVDITNKADAGPHRYGHFEVGGIAGTCSHLGGYPPIVVDNCRNQGNITVSGSIPGCNASVGGILGSLGFADVVKNCQNTGGLQIDCATGGTNQDGEAVQAGGITGKNFDTPLWNCCNTGAVSVKLSGLEARCNGIGTGMSGSKNLSDFENCWTSGPVSITVDGQPMGTDSFTTNDSFSLYYLDGSASTNGAGQTFSQRQLTDGTLVNKLNDYVREHPGEGLLAWVQGPEGPVLSDSTEVPAASQPAAPFPGLADTVSFTDVKPEAYYYEPVQWAVFSGVTGGTSASTFSPERTCSRAEIVTFLYRFLGQAPTSANPFADVKASDYYYDAALWAYETGLVSGPVFGGSTPCTRLEAVTYLWKLDGSAPLLSSTLPFADVTLADAPAVAWAAEQGITGGTGASAFSPERTCSRAEIVTFLYRFLLVLMAR